MSSGRQSSTSLRSVVVVAVTLLSLFQTFHPVDVFADGDDSSERRAPTTKRRVARSSEGDVIIGALFPVHRQPSIRAAFTRQCGEVCNQPAGQRAIVLNTDYKLGIEVTTDETELDWFGE